TTTVAPVGGLVGRERELDVLLAAHSVDRSGEGRVVEVVGDEGTGKSRLVAEARRHAEDLTWITVVCDPFERTSAYHSARQLLRRSFDIPLDASRRDTGLLLREAVERAASDLLPWLPLLAVAL